MVSIFLLGSAQMSFAQQEKMPGMGWHYPYKDRYANWEPPIKGMDQRMFNQEIIESYGWKAKPVEEIKDLLPPSIYMLFKDPETWGIRRLNITSYIPNESDLWKKFVAATEKYKGTASIDEKGWIRNYQAGAPFPEPKSGVELVWNTKKRFSPDDRILGVATFIVDRGKRVRYKTSDGNLIFYDGRLIHDPKPKYTPNPENLYRMDVYATAHPYELQGLFSVIKQVDDPDKDDQLWLYIPSMRRIRHLSTAQKTDKLPGGEDVFWDKFDTFNGNPGKFTHKMLGKKTMLAVHNGRPTQEWIEGVHGSGQDNYWQKVEVYINEMKPKDPNYPFSKIIHYMDAKNWIPYYSDWYDQKGRLASVADFGYTMTAEGVYIQNNMAHIDLLRVHSTNYSATRPHYNVGLTPSYFTVENLKIEYPAR